MKFLRNVSLMLLVNFGILLTLSFLVHFLGLDRGHGYGGGLDYGALMMFCFVWGMAGSLISLFLSKFMAKMFYRIKTIDPRSADPVERKVYEMVRRSAERGGLPKTPEVGIYESPEPNAFATGPGPRSALVAVSTGLLQTMEENEVEGVIGHEITHITNGDMVTMTLLQGIVNATVMFVARVVGFFLTSSSRDEGRRGGMSYWIVTMLCEVVLGIFGMMVVNWFSRRREFRADAGGAHIAGREKMIAALEALKRRRDVVDNRAPSLNAFKISNSRPNVMSLFMTHPPLEVRIEALKRS